MGSCPKQDSNTGLPDPGAGCLSIRSHHLSFFSLLSSGGRLQAALPIPLGSLILLSAEAFIPGNQSTNTRDPAGLLFCGLSSFRKGIEKMLMTIMRIKLDYWQ